MQLSIVAPPGMGKTWLAKTPWGRKHVVDTDHSVKLLSDESPKDGARPKWVIEGAIALTYNSLKLKHDNGINSLVVTNLHHVFDDRKTIVVLPSNVREYTVRLRIEREDLDSFSDSVIATWINNYRDFAKRNMLTTVETDGYLALIPELAFIPL